MMSPNKCHSRKKPVCTVATYLRGEFLNQLQFFFLTNCIPFPNKNIDINRDKHSSIITSLKIMDYLYNVLFYYNHMFI